MTALRDARVRRRLRAALIDVVVGIDPMVFAVGGVGVSRARRLEGVARDETASRAALLAALVDALGSLTSRELVTLTGVPIERAREILAVAEGDDFGACEAPVRWAATSGGDA